MGRLGFMNLILFSLLIGIVHVLTVDGVDFADVLHNGTENWTSCEEFVANRTFNSSALLGVDWKVFYFWCYDYEDSYNVRFSVPSEDLIRRFRDELDSDILPLVQWEKTELFMETVRNFCALLIATEEPGVLRLIPCSAFNSRNSGELTSVPYMTYGFKLVDGYLGIMNCEQKLCYGLAPNDQMPKKEKVAEAAEKIGFRSPLGRSYLVRPPQTSVTAAPFRISDDAEDDFQLDIYANGNIMRGKSVVDDDQ